MLVVHIIHTSCTFIAFILQIRCACAAHIPNAYLGRYIEEQQNVQEIINAPDTAPRAFSGRGVIIVGGTSHNKNIGADYTIDALIGIASLRRVGCSLPIELWHDHDSRLWGDSGADEITKALAGVGVVGRDAFEEVIFMDADNSVLIDPTHLFDSPTYKRSGALFWPNLQRFNVDSPVWPIIGRKAPIHMRQHQISIEAGQMVVHRRKHIRPLELVHYFNSMGQKFYYQFGHGDTDLFFPAWLAYRASLDLVQTPVGMLGDFSEANESSFCGTAMVQFHPELDGVIVFAHRNQDKWSNTARKETPRWIALKKGRNALQDDIPADLRKAPGSWNWGVLLSVPNMTPALLSHTSCQCGMGRCLDFDTDFDRSEFAKSQLDKLALMERDLLHLKSLVVTDDGSLLQPSWWVAWARYVGRLDQCLP